MTKLYDTFQEDCLLAIRKIKEAKTVEDRIKASSLDRKSVV